MKKSLIAVTVALPLMAFIEAPMVDDKKADASINHRVGVMQTIKNSVISIRGIAGGQLEQADNYSALTDMLVDATSMASDAFKSNTNGMGKAKTTSKGAIWDNWEDFSKRIAKLDADAKALQAAAVGNNVEGSMQALRQVFTNCKSCHDEYRTN